MAEDERPPPPLVRVEDAGLVPDGGPARLVISRQPRAREIGDAVASAGGVSAFVEDRFRVVAVPSRLIDAAGRVGGAGLAEPLRAAVKAALDAWLGASPDLETPAGTVPCSNGPIVMGILNVTPDSFSDGGEFFGADHPDAAVARAHALIEAGAGIVDVGGESTRPGAEPVPEDEELARVLPVVEALAKDGVVVSVDTSKASVARAAVEAGAAMVNDVSAGALDGLLLPTVAELGVPYVAMHMRGTPRTMQRDPRYIDVVGEVFDFLATTVERLVHLGMAEERIVIDPGIGFGKTVQHNLELLRRAREFTSLGRPVLIGASRKSFLGTVTGVEDPDERLEASVVAAAYAVSQGVSIVRVHDVAETRRAVQVGAALAADVPAVSTAAEV